MSIEAKRTKRLLAGVLAGALALSVTPILGLTGTAAALEPATGPGSVCENDPEDEPFTDVTDADPAQAEIDCLFSTGITVGTSPTTYSPNANVQRRQMALFLARLADTLEEHETSEAAITELPDADGVTPFTDIAAENQETKVAIDRLNEAGIALGTTATTFSPGDNVTREQMAAFIVRLQEFAAGEAATPDNAPDAFNDDEGSFAEEELNILAAEGVYLGVGNGEVNPGDPITRRQMARVIIRKAQYMFEEGFITQFNFPGESNQDFAVAGDTETRTIGASGARTCAVSGLPAGTAVDFRVFPASDVIIASDGTVTFVDAATEAQPIADENAAPAIIANINGTPTTGQEVNDVITGGTASVTIVGTGAGDVVLVAWVDQAGLTAQALDLEVPATSNTNAKAPREAFGVGCPTVFFNEATSGTITAGEVTSANKDADVFTIGTLSYFYDANDVFQMGAGCTPTSLATFEGLLSPGDNISGTYGDDPASQSTFCILDDSPAPPGVATASNTPSTVTLTITQSATPTTDAYNVYRVARPANTGTCPDFTTAAGRAQFTLVGTVADPSPNGVTGGDVTFTDSGLTSNTVYCYVVTAVDQGDESTGTPAEQQTAATNETVRPQSLDTELTTSGGFGAALDGGDVIKVCFNEPMRAPDAGDAIVVTDGVDTGTITNGTNATFALGGAATTDVNTGTANCPANQTLVITLTGAPVDTNTGTGDNILQLPADITDSSGVTDLAGNAWDLSAGDVTIDTEDPLTEPN